MTVDLVPLLYFVFRARLIKFEIQVQSFKEILRNESVQFLMMTFILQGQLLSAVFSVQTHHIIIFLSFADCSFTCLFLANNWIQY